MWSSLAIALAVVNLGLAFTCALVLPTPKSSVPVRARIIALVGPMSGLVILALFSALVVLLTSGRERSGS